MWAIDSKHNHPQMPSPQDFDLELWTMASDNDANSSHDPGIWTVESDDKENVDIPQDPGIFLANKDEDNEANDNDCVDNTYQELHPYLTGMSSSFWMN